MRLLFVLLCSTFFLFSCEVNKVDERQLLIEELNNDIKITKEQSANSQIYLDYMGEDFPEMYPDIKTKINSTRTFIDSVVVKSNSLTIVNEINLLYKISFNEMEQNILFNNMLPGLYDSNQIDNIELIKLYREREIEEAFFDILQVYQNPHKTQDQFEQYKYLKKRFKACEE